MEAYGNDGVARSGDDAMFPSGGGGNGGDDELYGEEEEDGSSSGMPRTYEPGMPEEGGASNAHEPAAAAARWASDEEMLERNDGALEVTETEGDGGAYEFSVQQRKEEPAVQEEDPLIDAIFDGLDKEEDEEEDEYEAYDKEDDLLYGAKDGEKEGGGWAEDDQYADDEYKPKEELAAGPIAGVYNHHHQPQLPQLDTFAVPVETKPSDWTGQHKDGAAAAAPLVMGASFAAVLLLVLFRGGGGGLRGKPSKKSYGVRSEAAPVERDLGV